MPFRIDTALLVVTIAIVGAVLFLVSQRQGNGETTSFTVASGAASAWVVSKTGDVYLCNGSVQRCDLIARLGP